jgi:hypothetical protein
VVNATNHVGKKRWQHARNGRGEEQPIEKRPRLAAASDVSGSLLHMGRPADLSFSLSLDRRYVSPKQAACYLGLSVFSIYRLVERRAIPFVPLHPSGARAKSRASVRFDLRALDTWMRKQTVKPSAEYVDERTRNE